MLSTCVCGGSDKEDVGLQPDYLNEIVDTICNKNKMVCTKYKLALTIKNLQSERKGKTMNK